MKKLIAYLLSAVMILSGIPLTAYANEEEAYEEITLIEEEEYRTENSKTFFTSEGTYISAMTVDPICFEKDGEYQDIDNTIIKKDKNTLTNTNNSYQVELPKTYENGDAVVLEKDGHRISIALSNDLLKTKSKISTNEIDTQIESLDDQIYQALDISKTNSTVEYSGIMEEVNLEYQVMPSILKENVILQAAPQENFSLEYTLSTGGLEAVLNDDKSISINDKENTIFTINPAYMFDAEGNESDDIAVSITETETGTYSLTYTPNQEWLTKESTVYPVTIDPDITTETIKGSSYITDTYVSSAAAGTNYKSATTLDIQNQFGGTGTIKEAYFQFNSLPEMPDGFMIYNASFGVYKSQTGGTTTNNTLNISAVHSDVAVSSLTYNSRKNKITEDATEHIDTEYTASGTGYLYFNITSILTDWINNNTANKILRISGTSTTKTSIKFASTEYSNSNCRPILKIEYAAKKGLNDSSKFHKVDMGYGGTAYINDATGELTVNTYEFDYNAHGTNNIFSLAMGQNIVEDNSFGDNVSFKSLESLAAVDNNEEIYRQNLCDGSINYYVQNSNNHYTNVVNNKEFDIFSDDDKLVLQEVTDAKYKSTIKYNTQDGNYLIDSFSTETPSGEANYTHFNYCYGSDGNAYIRSISDDSGSTYTFLRDDDTIGTNILDSEIKENLTEPSPDNPITQILFTNTSDNERYLSDDRCNSKMGITIKYDDHNRIKFINTISQASLAFEVDNTIGYHYNTDNRISRIVDENGISTVFDYDNQGRVSQISKAIFDEETDEIIASRVLYNYTYDSPMTVITDEKGNKITETFNRDGSLLSIKNNDGNIQFVSDLDENFEYKVSDFYKYSKNYIPNGGFESVNDCCFELNDCVELSTDEQHSEQKSIFVTDSNNEEPLTTGFRADKVDSIYTISCWVMLASATSNVQFTVTTNTPEGTATCATKFGNTEWQQLSCSIESDDSKYINISLDVTGYAYIDDLKAENSSIALEKNLIKNNEFSKELGNWSTNTPSAFTVTNNIQTADACDSNILAINNEIHNKYTIGQCIELPSLQQGTSADSKVKYTYGAYSKNINTLPASPKKDRFVRMSIYASSSPITIDNYTNSTCVSSIDYLLQNDKWQYLADELELNQSTKYVFVLLESSQETGITLFDGLSLYQKEFYVTNLVESDDGFYLETAPVAEAKNTEKPTNCSDEDILFEATDEETGETYKYYLHEKISNSNNNEKYVTFYGTDFLDDVIWGSNNSIGEINTYIYNYYKDIYCVTDTRGNIIYRYLWDEYHKLIGKETENNSAEPIIYRYYGSLLRSINTTNVDATVYETIDNTLVPIVSFEYDMWGNISSIIYGEDDIIQFSYNDYGELETIDYPDGSHLELSYDNRGNVIHVTGNPANGCVCESQCDDASCCGCSQTDSEELCGCENCDSCRDEYLNRFIDIKYFYYDNNEKYASYDLISNKIINYQNGIATEYDAADQSIYHSYGKNDKNETIELSNGLYTKSYNKLVDGTQNKVINSTEAYTVDEDEPVINNKTNIIDTFDDFGRLSERSFYSTSDSGDDTLAMRAVYAYYDSETDPQIPGNNSFFDVKNILEDIDDNDETIIQSDLIRSITYYNGQNSKLFEYRYLYDTNGNIASYTKVIDGDNGKDEILENYLYAYNDKGEIIQESNIFNTDTTAADHDGSLGILFDYEYDDFGNILSINSSKMMMFNNNVPLSSLSFSYEGNEYSRKLTTFNGNPIEYNSNGSIISYGNRHFLYSANNLLTSYKTTDQIIDYKYNPLGRLDYESVTTYNDSNTTNNFYHFYWRDELLSVVNIEKHVQQNNGNLDSDTSYNVAITYDLNNNPCGFLYIDSDGNATPYYYITDATNRILGIVNSQGEIVASYQYDAWGRIITDTAYTSDNNESKYYKEINPLVYKGNLYDVKADLYYVNNRFYSPELCKYTSINPNIITSSLNTTASNVYSYCENNPINKHSNWGTDASYDYSALNEGMFYNSIEVNIPSIY